MITLAKEKHDIDFQDAEQIAERGKEEAYREQYEQLMRKLDILDGSLSSQNKKCKIRIKAQNTKLDALKDMAAELEHQIALQDSRIDEKRKGLQILQDQKKARQIILRKQRQQTVLTEGDTQLNDRESVFCIPEAPLPDQIEVAETPKSDQNQQLPRTRSAKPQSRGQHSNLSQEGLQS